MHTMKQLVTYSNVYVSEVGVGEQTNIALLETIARYITKMFKIFGVIGDHEHVDIGFESAVANTQSANSDQAEPIEYLEAFSNFREEVRKAAIDKDHSKVMSACDVVRNDVLPELGVRLEDTAGSASIKIVGKKQAMQEKSDRLKEQAAKAEKKRLAQEKATKEKAEKEAKRRIKPENLFKQGQHAGKFTQFDSNGMPTHEACEKSEEFPSGDKPVGKGQQKKLKKLFDGQTKLHNAWLAEQ